MRFEILALAYLSLAFPVQAADRIPAEAEVSASSGPIKLTLDVYKKHLKLLKNKVTRTDFARIDKDYPNGTPGDFASSGEHAKYEYETEEDLGEPLWVRVGITNVGKNPILVGDDIFTGAKDFLQAVQDNTELRFGVYFVVIGPDGKPIDAKSDPEYLAPVRISNSADIAAKHEAEEAAAKKQDEVLWKQWLDAGYSPAKATDMLNARVGARIVKSNEEWNEEVRKEHPAKILKPGETAWTGSFVLEGMRHGHDWTEQKPIGDFAELLYYDFNKPGTYKIRAVYNLISESWARDQKKYHEKIDEWLNVRVKTPQIAIRVQR